MASRFNAYLLLAALLQCAAGAPVEDALADSPAGDTSGDLSGEEETSPDRLKDMWEMMAAETEHHAAEFQNEFNLKYHLLNNFKIDSLPGSCDRHNHSKQASFYRLVIQDMLTYIVFFKYVEKVYPVGSIASKVSRMKSSTSNMIDEIKKKMRNPVQVTELTSSQEEQLLRDIDTTDTFQRKMRAHSILYRYRSFLRDCVRHVIIKRPKQSVANRGMAPVSFYNQKLER